MVACPPPSARMAIEFSFIRGREARVSAMGNISSELFTVIIPALLKALLATAEMPASAPVWEPADLLPLADLPLLKSTTGFSRLVLLACSINLRPSLSPST